MAAGVWWPVSLPNGTDLTSSPSLSAAAVQNINLPAASPGAVAAMGVTLAAGSRLTAYENDTAQHVAMIDTATAQEFGISPARLGGQPAVFADESAMLIPEKTALADYGNPRPGIGNQDEAQMVIATKLGAAKVVGQQIAAAELPEDPSRLVVTTPPNPQSLQSQVSGDLTGLFLIPASISLLIGAVGIANTTLVAVLERTEEICLRRALGARPRHIASQFLAESTVQQYRVAYAKELGKLSGLLTTAPTKPPFNIVRPSKS